MNTPSYLPVPQRSLTLRGTRREIARAVVDSTTEEEQNLREFFRNYVHMAIKAKLGATQVVTFLNDHTPVWDGGTDPVLGKTYTSFWRRLIDACQRVNADPVEYLTWYYSVWSNQEMRSPVDIERNFAFDQFALRDKATDIEKLHLLTMRNKLDQLHFKFMSIYGYSKDASFEAALSDGVRQELSPLFIYCVALQKGLTGIAERYRGMATYEYLLSRAAVDQVWGELIPAEFKNQSSLALLQRA